MWESEDNLHLMRLLDEQYTKTLFYEVMKMTESLRQQGHEVNPKRVRRLLRKKGSVQSIRLYLNFE